jgi:pullulanase/glycogen debranching enzyme
MLSAGDELGHTQQGNNNPYCQDNPITWIDWSRSDDDLVDSCARLIALRRQLLPLGEDWHAESADGSGLAWCQPSGEPLSGADWNDPAARAIGVRIGRPGRSARPLLLLVNAYDCTLDFHLPAGRWRTVLDSGAPALAGIHGPTLHLAARCVMLLHLTED